MNMVIETPSGHVVIDTLSALENGCTAWIHIYGETKFARLLGRVVSFNDGLCDYDSSVMWWSMYGQKISAR